MKSRNKLFQRFRVVSRFSMLKNKSARICETEHCRRCSREIKQYFISVLFDVVRATLVNTLPGGSEQQADTAVFAAECLFVLTKHQQYQSQSLMMLTVSSVDDVLPLCPTVPFAWLSTAHEPSVLTSVPW